MYVFPQNCKPNVILAPDMNNIVAERLCVLRNRINERKELNAQDVALCDDAAEYIRFLESRVAALEDKVQHQIMWKPA